MDSRRNSNHDVRNAFQSPTFDRDVQIRVNETVGSASISPSGRDVVLASAEGLHIIDLDSPYSPPRHLSHQQQWPPADVQWSPFASRAHWIVSTSNQKALVWNLDLYNPHSPIQHTLHAHSRAITDINFSAHHPDLLATCAVDSYVHCWDLRRPAKPVISFADWNAGATQVKWNRQDEHILASSHDRFLKIWDDRKGAYPLKTIKAHTTKIYGVDWNRTRPTGVLTCSLDKSIKFWDYSKEDDEPERVIRTRFPVWRARHTPFGWGVLALPQRGNNGLHLYDRRLASGVPRVGFAKPVHSFQGHQDHVKEFLWRSRGDVESGIDNRDFQLISWGIDRDLHLHRIDPQVFLGVGHEKGKDVRKNMPLTRRGAEYKSYREPPVALKEEQTVPAPQNRPGYLGALVSAAGMSKMPLPMAPAGRDSGFMTYTGRNRKRTVNPIKWMEGVTMGSRRTDAANRGLDSLESLSLEMTAVSQRYTKVNFEKADVHGRAATVTLNGPWGLDEKPAFLRVHFEFPTDYPHGSSALCSLERTAAGIPEDTLLRLIEEVKSIAGHYQIRKTGCLEAIVTYLLGERGLEESITSPAFGEPFGLPSPGDDTSSDEDDVVDEQAEDLETSATDALGTNSGQANVPLPKGCGAFWSNDGRLVCFFPPKPEPKPLFSLDTLRTGDRANRSNRHFEGFGRLAEDSPLSKRRHTSDNEFEDTSSVDSWTSSSSSSSEDSSEDISRLPSRFHPPMAWRAAALRFEKTSSHSSGTHGKTEVAAKPKSVVSIHDFSDLLPAKMELAEDYLVFGDGPMICSHNAEVASRNGHHEIAATWEVAGHILHNEVPLEIMEQSMRQEPILVLAKRGIVRVRRKDSGLDLGFDEPPAVANPMLTGRVKWGKHPFGSSWLIPELFDHFERLADIQMLAMLSCVFCEPAARDGVSNALTEIRQQYLPIPMKAPAFSLDYFPSRDVAWSLFRESREVAKAVGGLAPAIGVSPGSWDYFDGRIGTTYGSNGSSNGPWVGDVQQPLPSAPPTPYSTGNTPPSFPHTRSHRNSIVTSLSTSPEQHQTRTSRRSNSNFSAAFSSFSRPFAINSSSPIANDRFRPDTDLSNSAPATAITWGSTTFYSGSSSLSPEKRRRSTSKRSSSFAAYESGYSTPDENDHFTDSDDDIIIHPALKSSNTPIIKVTLKNQHLFDEEAHASVPLVPPEDSVKYAAYREIYADLLSVWGLYIPRAEVLKFNGLTNYWPVPARMPNNNTTQQQQADPSGSALPAAVEGATLHKREVDILRPRWSGPSPGAPKLPTEGYAEGINKIEVNMFGPFGIFSDDPVVLTAIDRERKLYDRTGAERNRMLAHPEVLERERLPGEEPLATTERLRTHCLVCRVKINGVFYVCATGIHKAHEMCHTDSFKRGHGFIGKAKVDSLSGLGCGCLGSLSVDSNAEFI